MSNVKLSAFSDEYAPPLREQLEGMTRFGIGHIELRHIGKRNVSVLTDEELREAKALLDEFGIGVSAIGSPLGKIRLDEDMDAHLETAKRVFETANLLDAKFVRMFSFYAPEGEDIHQKKSEVLAALEKMLLLAEKYGVVLCHENEARIYGDTPERCRELLDHFGGELKCVFDMGNFVLEGVDPYPAAYELLQKDIAYFHIKDALFADAAEPASQGAIVPPGKGHAKIREILDAHRRFTTEDFFISLEPHLQVFDGLENLVGRSFENPYQYESKAAAFADAVEKLKELI